MMNAIRRIKQFAGKKSRQSLSRLFERDGSSAYCIATVKFIADGNGRITNIVSCCRCASSCRPQWYFDLLNDSGWRCADAQLGQR